MLQSNMADDTMFVRVLEHKVVTIHYAAISVAKADHDSMQCLFLLPVQQKK